MSDLASSSERSSLKELRSQDLGAVVRDFLVNLHDGMKQVCSSLRVFSTWHSRSADIKKSLARIAFSGRQMIGVRTPARCRAVL